MYSFALVLTITAGLAACGAASTNSTGMVQSKDEQASNVKLDTATFGGGCFWCIEAIYQQLQGVHTVVSGYSGGQTENPSYKEVCSGNTGHAEVTQITYDPEVISFVDLLEVFWQAHDPTTLNRQGGDVGTQYRSIILYHNPEQERLARESARLLQEEGIYEDKIVTEFVPLEKFWPAEVSHQDYYALNPNQGYCRAVIRPKVEKVKKLFKEKLK